MAKQFNCKHEASDEGEACAACLAEAYGLIGEAEKLFVFLCGGSGIPRGVEDWREKVNKMKAPYPYREVTPPSAKQ